MSKNIWQTTYGKNILLGYAVEVLTEVALFRAASFRPYDFISANLPISLGLIYNTCQMSTNITANF